MLCIFFYFLRKIFLIEGQYLAQIFKMTKLMLSSIETYTHLIARYSHLNIAVLNGFTNGPTKSRLPPEMVSRIEEILGQLDVAIDVQDMDLPHFHLHPLSGDRAGQWAVTVRANWRIVFRFDVEPQDVDFTDYH